jgi:hypothetical protein
MATAPAHFSDKDRARLRERLQAHAERYGLSAQKISDQIVEKTGFATAIEGGRRRVDRFLKAQGRQSHDFIAAAEKYLNQVAPEDVEESAIAVARLFTQSDDEAADLSGLVGSYEVYLKPIKPASDALSRLGFENLPPLVDDWPKIPPRLAYARVTMTLLERSNALLVGEAIINAAVEPERTEFPSSPGALVNAGVLMPFGRASFLMVTKSANESRFFQLRRPVEDTGRFVGFLTFNGSEPKSLRSQYKRQVFDPDYEVELIKTEEGFDPEK